LLSQSIAKNVASHLGALGRFCGTGGWIRDKKGHVVWDAAPLPSPIVGFRHFAKTCSQVWVCRVFCPDDVFTTSSCIPSFVMTRFSSKSGVPIADFNWV